MNDYKLKYSYGSKGKRGIKGDKGCSGIIGNYGDCGIQGPHGIKGEKGEIGNYGESGQKGEEGNTGSKGNIGDATFGVKGQKGEKGIHMISVISLDNSTVIQYNDSSVFEFNNNSLKGTIGESGNSGLIGIDGISGTNGEVGLKGEKGYKGEKGLTGNSLMSISQTYINSNYNVNIQNSNNSNSFNINLQGNDGPRGDVGNIGNSISAFIASLKYGFKINGNSAVIFTCSQKNDNEFYMQKHDNNIFITNKSDNIFSSYYYDLSESCRYISSTSLFNEFFDRKIIGLYNTAGSKGEPGNVLAGSLDSISPINNNYYNQLDVSEHFSRGLTIISQGNQKLNRNTNIDGISVNIKSVLNNTINGFEYRNDQYILTNNAFPIDNSKFYGIMKINNFNFYMPIKIFIRLEEHSFIGKKEKTTYKFIANDIILENSTVMNQDCAANTLLKYSNWFCVESNEYLSLSELVWNIYNDDLNNYSNVKLCVRYKFSLPSDIRVGNIINNFDSIINQNVNISNGINTYESDSVLTELPLINSVLDVNEYNNLSGGDKNIYLPQITNTLVPINELTCIIKTSTN